MEHTVYIVDDEEPVIAALRNLLGSEGYAVSAFTSPQAFLSQPTVNTPCCLIVDINMPGMDGFEVSKTLNERGYSVPTIFLTGFGTIPITVKAMKAGAYEFLTKPVMPEPLLLAVAEALRISAQSQVQSQEKRALTERIQSLTPRETEVMQLAVSGLLNKQIAAEMGVSEITAKVHKRRVMEKMQARSLTDLVRAVEKINRFKEPRHSHY
ncbi:response regulator transcription factor [Nissabacter sp. SGAir0207]|uniref:response regulator transcription factor n=1 Tax=Nissabacter sp. SGAir0207 TaxID=2126321 RepID=UPI0010CD2E15|nr:response regulator [Nissabacter sp. SGAir0207]QCR38199.1 DNA-binding response regulator [Nissabacter sp. SGAir0207]